MEEQQEQSKPRIIENPANLKYKQESIKQEIKPKKEGILKKLKRFWIECKRVLRVTKKPDKQEFKLIVKISAIGMAVMGIIGFLIHFLKVVIFG